MHARGRDRSPKKRRARHLNSSGDEAPFGSDVPHHTPPALPVSATLLSHIPTPAGSLVKDGVVMIIRGSNSSQYVGNIGSIFSHSAGVCKYGTWFPRGALNKDLYKKHRISSNACRTICYIRDC